MFPPWCLLLGLALVGVTGGAGPEDNNNNTISTNSTEKPYRPPAGDVDDGEEADQGTEMGAEGDLKEKYGATDSVGLTAAPGESEKGTTEAPVPDKDPLLTLDQLEAIPGPWSCESRVYCRGPLLDAVQRSRVFPDSKTFVDMPMKNDPDTTLKAYEALVQKEGPLSKDALKAFVNDHFAPAGEELEAWTPPDWVDSPEMLELVRDPALQKWAGVLHGLWRTLGRRIKDSVPANSTWHSLLHVPNGFVVPGDRFREIYYWDTYWIIKGLLVSGMTNTTRGVIENLLHMVDEFGFVPNGGRVYYKNRSQPPLLSLMVDAYYEATGDAAFVTDNLPLLEKEYDFWVTRRSVNVTHNGTTHALNRYSVDMTHPRAEGYLEDLEATRGLPADRAAAQFSHMASGAESGWDYSTRWFTWSGDDEYTLRGIKTADIVPVDLNAFLCLTETLLGKFTGLAGQSDKSALYAARAEARLGAMSAVLWHEEDGTWYDYDLSTNSSRRRFFLSNVTPLLVPANAHRATRVVDNLMAEGVLKYPGGVPTSRMASGQQWDFPNAWAPLVDILTTGLANADSNDTRELAYNISSAWVATNYAAWAKTGNMYEKYTVRRLGGVGKGGEYDVQKGFGWTNGVVLQMLSRHGEALVAPDVEVVSGAGSFLGHSAQTKVAFVFIPVVILIVAVLFFICFMMRNTKRRASRPSAKYSSPPFAKFN